MVFFHCKLNAVNLCRSFISLLGLFALSASVSLGEQRQPNVVLVLADDQGYGDVRSHGNELIDTPVHDRIATEGVRFDQFFVSPVWVTRSRAFGQADVQAMLEPAGRTPVVLKLNTLDTTLFLNTGDSLEKADLPIEAQFAPAFGCSVADFDGDGNEDIYLAQNFFNVESESSRYDAGLGLVMLGDGQGGFRALSSTESGVANLGQARGSVASNFDGDGRVDIVTAQNDDQVKLHLNSTGKPGLRVRLKGAGENTQAIGATIRLEQNGGLGPKREIRFGSGYWSQDSLVQLFVVEDSKAKFHIAG